jgi:hypothetical protein
MDGCIASGVLTVVERYNRLNARFTFVEILAFGTKYLEIKDGSDL